MIDLHKNKVGRPRKIDSKLNVLTFESWWIDVLAQQVQSTSQTVFPSPKYRKDPERFFIEVLGVRPWHRQLEIIEAIRDHDRVTVRSGHKVSKSHTAAGIALWFYCSFEDARVVLSSTTSRQVDNILWRETRMMRARSGVCADCKESDQRIAAPCEHSAIIDGEMGELARTGLKSQDFREIQGFTAREAEAVAGVSGKNLLYILDEASGIKPEIFEAIEGNRAGGAWLLMFSNPTRTSGDFYESHTSKKRFYKCIQISSEETPNVVFGDDDPRAIPGLASRAWIEEKKDEWGEDSPLYKVRVKGDFVELDDSKIFSIHMIAEAEQRWYDFEEDPEDLLIVGFDPAGDGEGGDESVWTARRGLKMIDQQVKRGHSKEANLMHTAAFIKEHARDREVPVLIMDRDGKVGAEHYGTFTAYLSTQRQTPFELVAIRASDKAHRNPIVYDRMRDELAGNLFDWLREGGAILEDAKLEAELHSLQWFEKPQDGRLKVTPKKDLRKLLQRSPDRYDSLALAAWEPMVARRSKALPPSVSATVHESAEEIAAGGMDPYAGADQWGR